MSDYMEETGDPFTGKKKEELKKFLEYMGLTYDEQITHSIVLRKEKEIIATARQTVRQNQHRFPPPAAKLFQQSIYLTSDLPKIDIHRHIREFFRPAFSVLDDH